LAIVKVMLVKASGKLSEFNNFISACRKSGEFHPENACQFLSGTMGFTCLSEENPYSAKLQKIEELTTASGIKLISHNTVDDTNFDDHVTEYICEIENALSSLYSDRKLLLDQLNECERGIEQFSHFKGLDVPVEDTTECEFVSVRYGHIPKEQMLKLKAYENNPYVLFIPCSSDAVNIWGVYFAPKEMVKEVDSIFAFMFFERIRVPGAVGTPTEIVDELQENVDILKQALDAIDKQVVEFWNQQSQKCNELYSRLKYLNDSFELRKFAAVKNDQYFFICWILKNNLEKFKKAMDGLGGVTFDISNTDESGRITPPVKLKNNRFFKVFESFVSMYGLPPYKGIDVTSFVAITYTLIFGIMFGDLGQGFVLAVCGLLAWKWKKISFGKLLILCGISSMFFGLIFGSVFGYEKLLDPVYEAIGLSGKPLEVMYSINTVLLVAIGIGIILMTISMFFNIYGCIKKGAYGEALFSNNGLTGILVYLSGVLAAYSFMSGKAILPGAVVFALMGVGLILLFFKEILIGIMDGHVNWKPKGKGDFIMQNFFELIEYILSYFSNTVSFLRIGAFVLVHAGMMMVVFSLAGESENIVIIALGNIVVLGLEGLLTGIQALRLEFYEIFSHFFEGNGRPFLSAEQAVNNKLK